MSSAEPLQGASAALDGGLASSLKTKREPRPARTRIVRRALHGVLLLDKPLGMSSNDALQKAKWLLRAEKAGHTGTLDPLATGVLPLCFGAATKFSQIHLDADKTYEAVAQLGSNTSTGDREGEVIDRAAVLPEMLTPERLAAITQQFTGVQEQLPPMYSALKKDGKALYEYARQGIEVEREARRITVFALNVELIDANPASAAIKFEAKVSKGTYIRTLGEDMGKALGCGAHLSALRRVQTGDFGLARTVTLAALEAMSEPERLACLLPVDSLLAHYPTVQLDAENAGRFLSGLRRRTDLPNCETVAVYGDAPRALLGSAKIVAGELIPLRLLTPLEVAASLQQADSKA